MLSNAARVSVGYVMWFGCLFKLYPYSWDYAAFRLRPSGLFHTFIWNIHGFTNCIMGTFAITRFMLALKFEVFPPRIRILNFAWCGVYSLGIVCFIQFKLNKRQILDFANSLFTYMDQCVAEEAEAEAALMAEEKELPKHARKESSSVTTELKEPTKNELKQLKMRSKKQTSSFKRTQSILKLKARHNNKGGEDGDEEVAGYDWTSICVLFSVFLLAVNPPIHAIMVVDSPCAPHFVSSMGLPCTFILENFSLMDKLPYIMIETLLTSVFFFNFTFNWICVFLTLAWQRYEMKKLTNSENNGMTIEEALIQFPDRYRYLQSLTAQLNASFIYYLQFSPSILMGVVALLTFGAVRYYHLHFTAYMMYPLCGGRCMFEAITNLGWAGMVNYESHGILKKWKDASSTASRMILDKTYLKLNKALQLSCAEIRCKAGSLYTFENTIVIATIHNCMQLTFNLLVMYR